MPTLIQIKQLIRHSPSSKLKPIWRDTVANSIGVESGNDIPTAINAILQAIELLKAPGVNSSVYLQTSGDVVFDEFIEMIKASNISDKPKNVHELLYLIIRNQQEEIKTLREEIKNNF